MKNILNYYYLVLNIVSIKNRVEFRLIAVPFIIVVVN